MPTSHLRLHLRICHNDGSESAPFPIDALGSPPRHDATLSPLRLGFVSGRHPELDTIINFYLIRHRELNLFDSSADKEQEVYERTIRLFKDEAFTKPWSIEVYHTGLELVTTGFYRAVVDTVRRRRGQGFPPVSLLPIMWSEGCIDIGRMLQDSRGALEKHRLLDELERLTASYPQFLKMDGDIDDEQMILHWLLERPMLISERDLLCRQSRYATPVFDLLYRRTGYRREKPWGLG